jgi:2-polyprenyl-3-methyl-5-hydroxy-6-metoxy-1,4-benzoquinol methylase
MSTQVLLKGERKIKETIFDKDKVKHSLLLLSKRYNYNHWIYSNIQNFVGNNILEVGAGIGNITDFIMFKNKLTLIDIDQNYVDYLNAKYSFRDKANFKVCKVDIQDIGSSPLATNTYDTIICLNILEHLKNDPNAVENMSTLLQQGGRLIILVPALNILYGSMDVSFGHYRRYNKKQLKLLIKGLDLDIVKFYYLNFLGLFGWFINGRIFKNEELPENQTKLFDKLVPFLGLAEKIIKPPLGQSLILIAQKK